MAEIYTGHRRTQLLSKWAILVSALFTANRDGNRSHEWGRGHTHCYFNTTSYKIYMTIKLDFEIFP
jgi:hypothetical protein